MAVFAVAGGCSELFGPDAVELLLDKYFFGPCGGGWSPAVPPATRTVVDVRVTDDGRSTGPSPAHVAAVRRAGGRILHRYNVGMIRAELDVAAVPSLFEPGVLGDFAVANYVATVSDLSRRDITLIVFLSRDLTDDDVAAVEAVGARVLSRLDGLEGYIVEIDDAAIPLVRALPGVQSVGADSYGCLASRSWLPAEVVQRL